MSRTYNFGAGPAMLPETVLSKVKEELFDWRNTGVSIMEIGHRTPIFQNLIQEIEIKLQNLLKIPVNYKILLLPGGGQGQFSAIPMNLTKYNNNADYFITGTWSERAMQFAKKYCKVNIVASATTTNIPKECDWKLNNEAAYAFYCPNETINGISFPIIPDVKKVPLVADMTSCILSEPIDVSKFGLIFAAAQKNLGIAGITLVIIREDLLTQAQDIVPNIWDYKLQTLQHSSVNTPPTFPIYVMDLMLDWINNQGGLEKISQINQIKSTKLYNYIDKSNFYSNIIESQYRSKINVPFDLVKPELLGKFLLESDAAGLKFLKGHLLVGGLRASLYNAMPEDGVDKLIIFMQQFANAHND